MEPVYNHIDHWLWEKIFYYEPSNVRNLVCTNRFFHQIISKSPVLNEIAKYGWHTQLIFKSIENNNFDCFQFCVDRKMFTISNDTYNDLISALVLTDIKYVKYFFERGGRWWQKWIHSCHYLYPKQKVILNYNGNTEICQYMIEHYHDTPDNALKTAIVSGDLLCLELIYNKYHQIHDNDLELMLLAIQSKQVHCMKFLHQKGITIPVVAFEPGSWHTNYRCWLYGCQNDSRVIYHSMCGLFVGLLILFICVIALSFFIFYMVSVTRNK